MNRVLVTGGAGFIGHHLLKRLFQLNCHVTVIDNLSNRNENFPIRNNNNNYYYDALDKNISFYKEDIRNKDSISDIFKNERIDTCIHLAAKISVSESVLNPYDTLDVNINGTLNVLEACSNNQVRNFVFASSAAAYGEPKKLPISEDHPLDPLSPYGLSKGIGETLVSTYRNLKKLQHTISLRFFNVYGEGQTLEYAGVIPKFAERLSKGLPPIIYGDGKQTRDFVSVNDVVNAILLAAESPNNNLSSKYPLRVFNIATGKSISINELAQMMIRIYGFDFEPIYERELEGDIKYAAVDMTNSKNILGFVATEQLELALKQMIKCVYFCKSKTNCCFRLAGEEE
jgi:UDP-glucose 4-epimerase